MNLKETYNKIAADWYKDHGNDDWWVEGTDAFISALKQGASVLDVGCGAGVKSNYLSKKGLTVLGIDFSEKFIELAKQKAPLASFEIMDMKEVVNLKRQFAGVFAQSSLLHIPKKEVMDVIKGLVAVLESEGYLYAAVKGMRPDSKEEEVVEENDYGYSYQRFFSFFSMTELETYFSDSGLTVTYKNNKIVGRTNWLQIIGQKKSLK